MNAQVVFNLFPFNEHLYLPSAFLVQLDAAGEPTYILQKATAAILPSFGLAPNEVVSRLLGQVEILSAKNLEQKFKPPKARTITPLAALLADKTTKTAVETFIHRELDKFLADIALHRLPIALDAEKRTLVKNVLIIMAAEPLIPHISFKKSDQGIEYRLQLGNEQAFWPVSSRPVIPMTNTEPAWLLVDHVLFRVNGINGNMVRPFRQKDMVYVPADKEETYFRQFVAKTAGRTHITAEGFDMHTTDQMKAARLEPVENIMENNWLLKVHFEYDGAQFMPKETRDRVTTLHIDEQNPDNRISIRQVCRNGALERDMVAALLGMGVSENGRFFQIPGERAGIEETLHWLMEHQDALREAGFTVQAPEAGGRALYMAKADLSVSVKVENDWFDVYGRLQIGEFEFPFHHLFPYIRRKDPYFPLPNGCFFLIPAAWMTRYSELAEASSREQGAAARLPKTLFTVLQNAGLDAGDAAPVFPEINPENIEFEPPETLKATLRPYQTTGVKWLIGHYRHGFGACLADDMGLGKTLQTIAVLLHAKENQQRQEMFLPSGGPQLDLFNSYRNALNPLNALIILPASLVFNWQQELMRFAPSLFVYVHTGPKRLKDVRAMGGYDVVLTTYHTTRQDLALLEQMEWHYIILDESQQIKNRESELSKVVRSLKARNKISLSGTPIENSLSDLWTQMEFINPDTLGSFASFREQFLIPIEKQQDALAKERLFNRVRPFFLRRTKEEVAPDLPALSEQVFFSEMAPAQKQRYEKLKSAVRNEILSLFDDPKTRMQALAALTRLRQLANHPLLIDPEYSGASGKFDDVAAQWDTIRKAGHKVLIFSSFEQHLQIFRRELDRQGAEYAWLTGATPAGERGSIVQNFQENPGVQAFLMTLKAGGVGLNLTAADYVFILDPWWNPAAEAQAIARAHRIGQKKPVTAVRFIAKDSIEEKIRDLQARKLALGKSLFDENAATPHLDRADLEALLG